MCSMSGLEMTTCPAVLMSLRAVGEEASRADVEAYKRPASSSSATTTLGEIMNWKRAGNDQE